MIGYIGDDEEDPPQASSKQNQMGPRAFVNAWCFQVGSTASRQSKDIQQLITEGLDVPVAKDTLGLA